MPSNRLLVRGGVVVSVDPAIGDLWQGDVLIEGTKIAAVGPAIDATDCAVVDATDCIVMPGFVDTHRHTWQAPLRNIASDWSLFNYLAGLHLGLSGHFRPEDTYAGNFLGVAGGRRRGDHHAAGLVAQPQDAAARRRGDRGAPRRRRARRVRPRRRRPRVAGGPAERAARIRTTPGACATSTSARTTSS